MEQLFELLQFSFVQRALIAGSFIAISCAFLGVFLVLRRFSLVGDGLAHVSFAAIALGLFVQVTPVLLAIPIVIIGALLILLLAERSHVHGDAAIGILSSMGIATGILVASLAGGFNVDLFSYLFGNILSVSRAEVILSVLLSLLIIAAVRFFYHDLFAVTFDPDHAKVSGIRTGVINKILVILTALTVVLGIKVAGTMLVSSLIIFPAVSALFVARAFWGTILLAAFFAVVSVIVGIVLACIGDLPAGAAIVYVNFFIFVCSFLIRGRK